MSLFSTQGLLRGLRLAFLDPATFYRRASRIFRPMAGEYRDRLQMTLREWLLYHQNHLLHQCSWMGTRMFKSPLDAWICQEILYAVQPEIIIEIGSCEGGSTLYFAQLLDLIGKGTIISVDIDRSKFNVRHPRIVLVTGNSSSPEVAAQVSELCRGKSVLVLHDGDHRKEPVLKDLEVYAPLVSLDSYLIVEDGIIDLYRPGDGIGTYEAGPMAAAEEFLRSHSNFIMDRERERYLMTYNPKGYLKRIR